VALACGLSLFGLASVQAGASAQAPDTIVEEVRQAYVGGRLVEQRVLIDTRLTGDPVAVADEVTGIPHETGGVSAQYKLNPRRWLPSAMPIRVSYNPALEAPLPSIAPAIANAIQQWSAVSPSTFALVYAGTTTAGTDACEDDPDGVNTVAYVPKMSSPSVLGLTCTYYDGEDSPVILEFDMRLNHAFDWGAGPAIGANQYDLASTVLHEMGHAAGLGHSSLSTAVMYFALAKHTLKRTLATDDIDGLRAQYPVSGPTIPTPVPTPTPIPAPVFNRDYQVVAPGVVRE
jgi:hypothetical protein